MASPVRTITSSSAISRLPGFRYLLALERLRQQLPPKPRPNRTGGRVIRQHHQRAEVLTPHSPPPQPPASQPRLLHHLAQTQLKPVTYLIVRSLGIEASQSVELTAR
jgi:hypothetical protein